jgi:hypothetical protein
VPQSSVTVTVGGTTYALLMATLVAIRAWADMDIRIVVHDSTHVQQKCITHLRALAALACRPSPGNRRSTVEPQAIVAGLIGTSRSVAPRSVSEMLVPIPDAVSRCAGGCRELKTAPAVEKFAEATAASAVACGADCDVVAEVEIAAKAVAETAMVLESMDPVNSAAASADSEENKIEITTKAVEAEAEAEAEAETAVGLKSTDLVNSAAVAADHEENKIEITTHAAGNQRLPLAVPFEATASPGVANIALFTVDDVFKWLVGRVGISVASATKLKDQEMSGRALLRMTEDKLTRAPLCLPAGAASNIAEELETWRLAFSH